MTGYFDVIQGQHLLDFWLNVCICHSLIVEQPKNGGLPTFQASQQRAIGVPCPATRTGVPTSALHLGRPHCLSWLVWLGRSLSSACIPGCMAFVPLKDLLQPLLWAPYLMG